MVALDLQDYFENDFGTDLKNIKYQSKCLVTHIQFSYDSTKILLTVYYTKVLVK